MPVIKRRTKKSLLYLVLGMEVCIIVLSIFFMNKNIGEQSKWFEIPADEMFADFMVFSNGWRELQVDESSDAAQLMLRSKQHSIEQGTYKLAIEYSCSEKIPVSMGCDGKKRSRCLHSGCFYLYPETDHIEYVFNINANVDDLELRLGYPDDQNLEIKSISYTKSNDLGKNIIYLLLFFFAVDICLFDSVCPEFCMYGRIISAISLFISIPVFWHGLPSNNATERLLLAVEYFHQKNGVNQVISGIAFRNADINGISTIEKSLLAAALFLRKCGLSVNQSFKGMLLVLNILTVISAFFCFFCLVKAAERKRSGLLEDKNAKITVFSLTLFYCCFPLRLFEEYYQINIAFELLYLIIPFLLGMLLLVYLKLSKGTNISKVSGKAMFSMKTVNAFLIFFSLVSLGCFTAAMLHYCRLSTYFDFGDLIAGTGIF